MKLVHVLGTGCAKCDALAANVQAAAEASGVEIQIHKVSDINEIVKFGVMLTPALVIDGTVKAVGKVPNVEQIKAMLK